MSHVKILYIEDEESQREDFEKLLRSKGFAVTGVSSGKAGLQEFKKSRPDIILCDLDMPELGGLDVLARTKKMDPQVPVIIFTARASVDRAVEAIKQGAYDFVLKPLQINKIEVTIQKAIENIKLQKSLKEINKESRTKAKKLEKSTFALASANVKLLSVQEKIATRLRYEEGLAACSRALLDVNEVHDAIKNAISHLLLAADVGRVYVFENIIGSDGVLCLRQSYELAAAGVGPALDDPSQPIPYKPCYSRWQRVLSKGKPIKGTLPENEKGVCELAGVLSILVLPISVAGEWYGFIGFDDLKKVRKWGEEDIRLLQTSAEMIGGYIEHLQAENALRESEERFRNLVEHANDIIYSLTPEGIFTYVSPNWADFLGHDVSEVLNKPFEAFIHPDDAAACREFLRRAVASGEKQSGIEYRVKHKNETWKWHASSASPLKDSTGKVVSVIGIAHDITVRKKILDDLEEANQHLRETQSQLVQSEKMAALGMLVAGIAHEINTPIGAVHSMHDTLQRAVAKLRTTLETDYAKDYQGDRGLFGPMKVIADANKVIENGSERVIEIVRRLRSFARLDEAELKTVDIHEGIEDTLTLIHHEIKHTIKIIKNYGDIRPISCFPGRLNQVYLNLFINAKQAIKGDGKISITTYESDHNVYVEIEDTGVGIPKDKLKKIFDPGFTTKGVGVGTGLGLSIVYRIMQDHRGEIKVRSEVGKGTQFTLVLPMDLDKKIEK